MTKPQINSLFALGGFAAMAASLLGGRFTDRYGGRLALKVGRLSHVAAMLAFVAYSTLLTRLAPDRSRGVMVGIFGTIVGVVAGVAPTVGAYLRSAFGSAAPFWVALGLGIAVALLVWPLPKDA